MKKALFFALTVALMLAVAAPAFAADPILPLTMARANAPISFGPSGFAEVTVGVNYALEIWIDDWAVDLSGAYPGSPASDSVTVLVKSNDSFKKSFSFPAGAPAIFSRINMTLDGVGYVPGTEIDHTTPGISQETLTLSFAPEWTDQAGTSATSDLLVKVAQY